MGHDSGLKERSRSTATKIGAAALIASLNVAPALADDPCASKRESLYREIVTRKNEAPKYGCPQGVDGKVSRDMWGNYKVSTVPESNDSCKAQLLRDYAVLKPMQDDMKACLSTKFSQR